MTLNSIEAKNISKLYFNTKNGVATFASTRVYGVLNSKGQALSKDGKTPATYTSLEIAKKNAIYCDGFTDHSWVDVFTSEKAIAKR